MVARRFRTRFPAVKHFLRAICALGFLSKHLKFAQDQGIRAVTFTFEGRARLFADLTRAGVSARRVPIELDGLPSSEMRASLQRLLDRDGGEASISDAVTKIEGGFLFRFPQVTYRVIGSFAEHTTRMKANIKAQLDQSAFVDSIDLYRNRDEVTEQLCPPEDVESVSDLSAQALYYYYGKDDLKHCFIVIGEKHGSEGSDYPLRELISRRSITKAVPMKDPVTGQVKTETITVNGPISLAETTTKGDVNPENLSRSFVVGIDESEDQTRLIHDRQRTNYTVDGFLQRRSLDRITERHHFAQRLLEPVLVFNPYAEVLTFPASTLKTRRDHEKFLRLINAICFLYQYQRKRKQLTLDGGETLEYIECTVADYRLAHELLSDGVLDNTLDDLPRPARELLELIKKYVTGKADAEGVVAEQVVFQRSQIRAYTSWSFAQIRNNFRTLADYEYIQLIKARSGLANQYRLSAHYSDLDFLTTILSPEDLTARIKAQPAAAGAAT